MKVDKENVVSITYSLSLDNGDLVDEAGKDEPFEFIFGTQQVIDPFELNLKGLSEGDEFEFRLSKEQAYGEYQKELVVDVPRTAFEGADGIEFEKGTTLPMQDPDGNPIFGVVLEEKDGVVKMDFNHPLAGQNLNFKGKIQAVRKAEPLELQTGSVNKSNN